MKICIKEPCELIQNAIRKDMAELIDEAITPIAFTDEDELPF